MPLTSLPAVLAAQGWHQLPEPPTPEPDLRRAHAAHGLSWGSVTLYRGADGLWQAWHRPAPVTPIAE